MLRAKPRIFWPPCEKVSATPAKIIGTCRSDVLFKTWMCITIVRKVPRTTARNPPIKSEKPNTPQKRVIRRKSTCPQAHPHNPEIAKEGASFGPSPIPKNTARQINITQGVVPRIGM